MKRIIIAGISGFLGTHLATHLKQKGYQVEGLTRNRDAANCCEFPLQHWDGRNYGPWIKRINKAHAVINLCGISVNCRYNAKNRESILKSRIESTRILGKAIRMCINPPATWINASTATIYRDARDRPMTETTGDMGQGFSVEVAKMWEETFNELDLPVTRKISLRTSLVLGHSKNSALPVLAKLARRGFGGHIGDGQQMFSWIHINDFTRSVTFLLENVDIHGPVNVTSPAPVTNREFMFQLRKILRIRFGLPTPKLFLKIGAWALRTEPELPLKSRWVLPEKLTQHRFLWKYPFLDEALNNLFDYTQSEHNNLDKKIVIKSQQTRATHKTA
ncbi:TIGR01777 family oxidoreductase [Puniceicoccaceae bacterium K14]|nr:TIGR01777 family oxidoreductase [Puniceicoccaceae bacterium K14]